MTTKQRYRVRVTRNVTESKDVFVEADSVEEANELALEEATKTGSWELDDGNDYEIYLPDPASTEVDNG